MKFCYGHHKMAVMLFYGRWTSKILLFVLSSYFLYMAIVHGGFSIESQTKSRTVKDGSGKVFKVEKYWYFMPEEL